MRSTQVSLRAIHWQAVLLRLCLILSLWRAPVPWVHHHGSDPGEAPSPISASELSLHLAQFHADQPVALSRNFGWHYHWVLPFWSHQDQESSKSEPPVHPATALKFVAVSVLSLPSGPVANPVGVWSIVVMPRSPSATARMVLHVYTSDSLVARPVSPVLRC